MKLRLSVFIVALLLTRGVNAVTVVTPTDPMVTNLVTYYTENFSTNMGALYSQHPGNGTWSVQNGKLTVSGVGATPAIVAAPESEERGYQNRSIQCDITVNAFEQSAMIVFGYSRDALGNDYFLCAGVYKGRWAIGYYPNEETGDFALLKAYDYGNSADPMYQWTSRNVENPFGTNHGASGFVGGFFIGRDPFVVRLNETECRSSNAPCFDIRRLFAPSAESDCSSLQP